MIMKKIYVISESHQTNSAYEWNISIGKRAFTTWKRAEMCLNKLIHIYEKEGYKVLKNEIYLTEKGYQRDVIFQAPSLGETSWKFLYRIESLKVNDEI